MPALGQGDEGRLSVHVKHAFNVAGAPKAIGPYSPAVRVGQWVFVSGQVPFDPATGQLIEGDIAAQTRRVLMNVGALLSASGLGFEAVVRTTVFLADMNDFAAMNAAYAEFFTEPYPARSTIQAARLPRDARVEIDAVAMIGD
ncbi:MAG: RidA family protein [Acidimicrobiia bacterium]|nr:RidA family protein [Acidimicrobiia bacterium]